MDILHGRVVSSNLINLSNNVWDVDYEFSTATLQKFLEAVRVMRIVEDESKIQYTIVFGHNTTDDCILWILIIEIFFSWGILSLMMRTIDECRHKINLVTFSFAKICSLSNVEDASDVNFEKLVEAHVTFRTSFSIVFWSKLFLLGDSQAQYRDDLYSYGEENRSLLYAATEFQITRLVRELLKKKADPNVEVKTINGNHTLISL